MKLFQTVKLDIEVWKIVDNIAQSENISFSESLERLIRHGSIRYNTVIREQLSTRD